MSTAPVATNVDGIYLSQRVKVGRYYQLERSANRDAIATFLNERFSERYLAPFKFVPRGEENGFLMMAASCLLIETLTAFREGWKSTKSELAFKLFFGRESSFRAFRGVESDFWKGVRCGILHHGETAKGWRLNFSNRNAELIEIADKRVNCFKFLSGVEGSLRAYAEELRTRPWTDTLWENLRKKMKATIEECQP